ncbi:hypothetical protein [Streptomyces daliensis]|uniref:ABC transporter permease n=1 Tax=Streptomyces daliensis TaxID=299421 RepID=A0A8T4IHT8_9ACTN|nr:hypothetical protein [Streptomyces daliensis]
MSHEPLAGHPGGGAHAAADAEAAGPRVRRELRDALVCGLAVTVLGVALGLLWLWLAPRVPLFTDGKAVYLKDPEGEEAIGADGTFILLALAAGVLSAVAVFLARVKGGVGLVVGLALGALLGSVVAWRIGVWLGPETDVVAAAKAAGANGTFDGPLKLDAKGGLLAWPFAAVLIHLMLTSIFTPRDPEPPFEQDPGFAEDPGFANGPGFADGPGKGAAPEARRDTW